MSEPLRLPTSLGTSDAEHIRLLGEDLTADLMGRVGFGELAFWLVALRRPTPSEVRVFEAVLVALADHGFTPTAIAARLTYLSAPDSLQGALAAGLLGGGSRFLGVTEDCGQFLDAVVVDVEDDLPSDDAGWDALALSAVTRTREAGRFVPGLGHPVHKVEDPRTPVLLRIADEEGLRGPHLRLFEAMGRVHEQVLGRRLPLNGAGVCGAALADLGLPVELLRGFALLARAAGLLGQLAEERRRPVGMDVYLAVDRGAYYVPPGPGLTRIPKPLEKNRMATVAAVIASTHHPFYYRASTSTGADRPPFADEWVEKIERFRETLTRARPDVLLMVGSDHFHQLWLDNMPQFLVGKAPFYDANFYNEEREFGLPRMTLRGPGGPVSARAAPRARRGTSTWRSATSCGSTTASPARSSRCGRRRTCRSCRSTPTSSLRRCRGRSGSSSWAARSAATGRELAVRPAGGHRRHRSPVARARGPRQFGPHGPDPDFDRRAVEWIATGDVDGCLGEVTLDSLHLPGNATHGFMDFMLMMGAAGDGVAADHVDSPRPVPHHGGLLHLVPEGGGGMSRYLLDKFLFTVDRDPDLVERYRDDPAGTVAWWEETMANRLLGCHTRTRTAAGWRSPTTSAGRWWSRTT